MLRQIDLIAAQNEESADRFARSAHRRTASTSPARSSTTVPKPIATIRARVALAQLAGIARRRHRLPRRQHARAGRANRRRYLPPARRRQHPRLRLILVPRHPERFDDVAELLDASRPAVAASHRSLQPQLAALRRGSPAPILLVDTVGELGAWWGTAHDRLRRRQLRQPRRPEHDRAGRLRRRRLVRPQHLELPRHRRRTAGRRRRRRRPRRGRARSVRPPLPRRPAIRRRTRRTAHKRLVQSQLGATARTVRIARRAVRRARAASPTLATAAAAKQPSDAAGSPRHAGSRVAHVLVVRADAPGNSSARRRTSSSSETASAATSSLVSPHTRHLCTSRCGDLQRARLDAASADGLASCRAKSRGRRTTGS